jgi:hypothetical protein
MSDGGRAGRAEIIRARFGLSPRGEMAPGSCGISIQEAGCIWTRTATRKYRLWVMGITLASIGHLLYCRPFLRVRYQAILRVRYQVLQARAQREHYPVSAKARAE